MCSQQITVIEIIYLILERLRLHYARSSYPISYGWNVKCLIFSKVNMVHFKMIINLLSECYVFYLQILQTFLMYFLKCFHVRLLYIRNVIFNLTYKSIKKSDQQPVN